MTLRALQSAANNKQSQAQLTWDAINQTGQEYGGPDIDYDRFAARWDSDPILKQLVSRFDGHGVVVKRLRLSLARAFGTAGRFKKCLFSGWVRRIATAV